jgi:hypothetical protein
MPLLRRSKVAPSADGNKKGGSEGARLFCERIAEPNTWLHLGDFKANEIPS